MFKKAYFLFVLLLGLQNIALSQRTKDYGARLCLNSPWLINRNLYNDKGIDYGFRAGYSGGLKAGMDLVYEFGINVELLYSHYGSSFYENSVSPYWSRRFSLNYLEMPILARYKVEKFYVEIGPQIGYLISVKDIKSNFNMKDEISTDKTKFNMLNYSAVLGCGIMVYEYERYNLYVGGRISYGVNGVLDEKKFNPTNNLYPFSMFPSYPPGYDPDLTVQNLPLHTFYIGVCAEFSWSSSYFR